MIITRTFGKLFRGTATPFQIWAACILGALLGFMPGFAQAAGLIVVLLLALAILNANLAIAGLVGLGSKLLALLLTPVSFAVGRVLLDGPTEGLARTLINAPVTAFFGFDYYVTTGGLALGLVVGVVAGWVVSGLITTYRRKMGALEEGSEKYKAFTAKKWVKVLTFLLIGGSKGKKTYNELLAKKVGNPVRPLGVVFAVLVVVLLFLVQMFFAGPIVTAALHDGLEKANGATVDIGEAQLDLRENRLTVDRIALADPDELGTDRFRAARLEADVSASDLLRKRLRLDRVVISEATQGETRQTPGRLVGERPKPEPVPEPPGDQKTLQDYVKEYEVWKKRLAEARRWLEKISGDKEGGAAGEEAVEESLRERLEREIREKGYRRVQASHLLQGAPTLTIDELVAEKVRMMALDGEQVDVLIRNLSTHPRLVSGPLDVSVKSATNRFALNLVAGALSAGGGTNSIDCFYNGLPVDDVAGSLNLGGQQTMKGGTIDIVAKGGWNMGTTVEMNLPLQVTIRDTLVTLPGGGSAEVESLPLSIGVTGPMDNPRIQVDDSGLTKSLAGAGVNLLKDKAGSELDKQLEGKVPEEAKGLLKGIFGGEKKKKE